MQCRKTCAHPFAPNRLLEPHRAGIPSAYRSPRDARKMRVSNVVRGGGGVRVKMTGLDVSRVQLQRWKDFRVVRYKVLNCTGRSSTVITKKLSPHNVFPASSLYGANSAFAAPAQESVLGEQSKSATPSDVKSTTSCSEQTRRKTGTQSNGTSADNTAPSAGPPACDVTFTSNWRSFLLVTKNFGPITRDSRARAFSHWTEKRKYDSLKTTELAEG